MTVGQSEQRLEHFLVNAERFLGHAQQDPSISPLCVQKWIDRLLKHLDMQSQRYDYALLHKKIIEEWLSKDDHIGESAEASLESPTVSGF